MLPTLHLVHEAIHGNLKVLHCLAQLELGGSVARHLDLAQRSGNLLVGHQDALQVHRLTVQGRHRSFTCLWWPEAIRWHKNAIHEEDVRAHFLGHGTHPPQQRALILPQLPQDVADVLRKASILLGPLGWFDEECMVALLSPLCIPLAVGTHCRQLLRELGNHSSETLGARLDGRATVVVVHSSGEHDGFLLRCSLLKRGSQFSSFLLDYFRILRCLSFHGEAKGIISSRQILYKKSSSVYPANIGEPGTPLVGAGARARR
mmetsp:Transcript_12518/g.19822  ORF Transcript_12518/g.19822 Transcript_12518/m.19822 type:complete len:261 (-) Transcript_12518:471-1253(-)